MINEFKFSDDGRSLILTLTTTSDIKDVYIYTSNTYRDKSKAYKVNNVRTTNTISISDLGINSLRGLFIAEVSTNNGKIFTKFLVDSSGFHKCIISNILEDNSCKDCHSKLNTKTINIFSIYKALELSSINGYLEESILLIKSLNKLCNDKCKDCGSFKDIITPEYYDSIK